MAHSIVEEGDCIEIACSAVKDDADIWGETRRWGGSERDGRLVEFLRERQDRRTVVFLDEFDKMTDLHSSIGWQQGALDKHREPQHAHLLTQARRFTRRSSSRGRRGRSATTPCSG